MGSLNNLYISQSFQSLIHLGSDNTASANLTTLQDGLGNSISISVNTDGDITALGDITASNLYAPIISASSGHFSNGLFVSGTISAYELKVVIESSSIIFTSGSNILGDEANVDTQTLVGRIINTGSLEVSGSTRITGNTTITGSLIVNGLVTTPNLATTASNNFIGKEQVTGSVDIKGGLTLDGSSSFTELTGSLSAFSQSISARILAAQGILVLQSQSVIIGNAKTLDFSGADVSVSFLNETGSIFVRTTQFATTGSNTFVGSNTFTQFLTASVSGAVFGLGNTVLYSQSVDNRIIINSQSAWGAFQSASAYSASAVAIFATTGSNTFKGTEIISGSLEVTGSMVYSGSVRGEVIALSISSQTASIDCSRGNFFTLTLVSGSTTHLTSTNIRPGETLSLKITQPSVGYGSVTYNNSIKFSQYFPYVATPISNAVDVLSAQSYDTGALYMAAINYMA